MIITVPLLATLFNTRGNTRDQGVVIEHSKDEPNINGELISSYDILLYILPLLFVGY